MTKSMIWCRSYLSTLFRHTVSLGSDHPCRRYSRAKLIIAPIPQKTSNKRLRWPVTQQHAVAGKWFTHGWRVLVNIFPMMPHLCSSHSYSWSKNQPLTDRLRTVPSRRCSNTRPLRRTGGQGGAGSEGRVTLSTQRPLLRHWLFVSYMLSLVFVLSLVSSVLSSFCLSVWWCVCGAC
jgi:hypothetical protein